MRPNWRINYVRYKTLFLNFVGEYRKRDDVKVYLELLLSLATISVFAVFALRPTLLTISRLIKEIETKKSTIEQMDNKIEDITRAQRVYDLQRTKIDMLKTAVPITADPDVILRQLEGAVSESNVAVTEFSLGDMLIIPASADDPNSPQTRDESSESNEVGSNNAKVVKLSISSTSDYINLLRLISVMERLRKPFNINTTAFEYEEQEQATSLTLTINAELPIIKSTEEE